MKTIKILITLIFFVSCISRIQAQVPQQGDYVINNSMGAFHGTWQWVNGADKVTITLDTRKVYFDFNGGYHHDVLVGWHSYYINNNLIESGFYNFNTEGRTFIGGNEISPPGAVRGNLKDLTKNKYGELTLSLNSSQNQLTWKLTELPGIRVSVPGQPYQSGFTLPSDIILIKL